MVVEGVDQKSAQEKQTTDKTVNKKRAARGEASDNKQKLQDRKLGRGMQAKKATSERGIRLWWEVGGGRKEKLGLG